MIRQFARDLGAGRELDVFLYHPIQMAGLLEAAWAERFQTEARRSPIPGLPGGQGQQFMAEGSFLTTLLGLLCVPVPDRGRDGCRNAVVFDHLIYAYLIENTRIYEIFRRVLFEYLHGERLEIPEPEAQQWLRTTEELFYRDTPRSSRSNSRATSVRISAPPDETPTIGCSAWT